MIVPVSLVVLGISADGLRAIQSVGILAGILVGVASILIGVRSNRGSNRAAQVRTLLDITASHRDIWRQYASRLELRNALAWDARPDAMTEDEQQWLRELVLHIVACYEAGRLGVLPPFEGLNADVRQLMAKPLPRAVWRELRPYQNAHFREFVEARLAEAEARYPGVRFGLPHGGTRSSD